jgi:streptogramin lyase
MKRPCSRLVLLASLVALTQLSIAQATTIKYHPAAVGSGPDGIVAGPDGALWFDAGSVIGRMTLTGEVTQYPVPNSSTAPADVGITVGSDGNIWFTAQSQAAAYVGRVCTKKQPGCPSIG